MAFSITWDEAVPAGTDDISAGDDAIRNSKTALRERLAVDHDFRSNEAGITTIGYHTVVHLIDQVATDPILPGVYRKANELYYLDGASNVVKITEAGALNTSSQLSAGLILMWSGILTTIPTGWSLCDGTVHITYGTKPNLLAKFIRGVATAATNPGATGGSETHAHTNPGTHAHSWSGSASANTNEVTVASGGGAVVAHRSHGHSVSGTVGDASLSDTGSYSTLPSYYELAFIIKV